MPTRQANRWHDDDGRLIFTGSEWDLLTEYGRLRDLVSKLQKALGSLIGEQNGPPLIQHKQKWYTAMMEAHRALGNKHGQKFYRDEATKAANAGANDERHT